MDYKEILLDTLQCAAFFDTVEEAFNEDQLGVIYEAMKRVEKLSIPDVGQSLPTSADVEKSATEWVFEKNGLKWSNNDDTAADNFSSFRAGAEWAIKQINK